MRSYEVRLEAKTVNINMIGMCAQGNRCTWKKILGVIAVLQILLFAVFQSGFRIFSRTPIAKNEVSQELPSKYTNLQDGSWSFNGLGNEENNQSGNSYKPQSNSQNTSNIVDVHLEDDKFQHTFEVDGHGDENNEPRIIPRSIAMGVAITSRKSMWSTVNELKETFPFFHTFLPTFCDTLSQNFSYNFFLSFDKGDAFFSDLANLRKFQVLFFEFVTKNCHPSSRYALHFVQCSHTKKPAWAQNDAMIAAYMANMEYYYRINDDTKMKTKGWTDVFIKTLNNFDPPNIGVVGPTHKGGNTAILTYDFVHYSHVELFGYYYPHAFTDWHADRWITDIYRPGRCVKAKQIFLQHTMEKGQRYAQKRLTKTNVKAVVDEGKLQVEDYVARLKENKGIAEDSRKVISMSLYGRDPLYTYGAIRNLQLHKIFLPEWTIRIYLAGTWNTSNSDLHVPQPVIDKLYLLGAKLIYLNQTFATTDPKLWRFLVADDNSVDYFLFRNTHSRLDDKYQLLVREWLTSDSPFFCARDFEKPDENNPIIAGLIGAKRKVFQTALGRKVEQYIKSSSSKAAPFSRPPDSVLNQNNTSNNTLSEPVHSSQNIVSDVLWSVYKIQAKCYDSNKNSKWQNSQPFPDGIAKKGKHPLASLFNQFEQVIK